jgi:hypothetical protein
MIQNLILRDHLKQLYPLSHPAKFINKKVSILPFPLKIGEGEGILPPCFKI